MRPLLPSPSRKASRNTLNPHQLRNPHPPRNPHLLRRGLALSAAAAAALAPALPALAANTVFTYNGPGGTTANPTTGNFNTASNWNNGAGPVPASAATTELDFNSGTTNYIATDDVSGALSLNEIQFNVAQSGTGGGTVAAAAGNSLNFVANGTVNPTVVQNGTAAFTLNVPASLANNLTFAGLENPAGAGTANGAITVSGALFGAGNLAFGGTNTVSVLTATGGIDGGYGAAILNAANTYTGTTSLNAGGLTLDFTTDTVASGATSRLSTAALTLGGGTLTVLGSSNVATSQTVGGTTLNGGSSIVVNTGTGQAAALNLGAITRVIGGAADFSGTGSAITTTPNTAFTGGTSPASILGGWATFGGGSTFAVSAGDGVTPVSGLPTASYSTSFAAGTDVDAPTGTSTPGAMTINSLRFNNAGAYTVTTAGNIVVASGGILETANVGNNAVTISGNTISSGNGTDLIVHQYNTANTLSITSAVGGTAGLTKTGPGNLTLGTANTYTGDTYIDGGTLTTAGGNGSATAGPFGILSGTQGTAFKRVVLTNNATLSLTASYNDNTPSTTVQGQVFFIGAGGGQFNIASGTTFTVDDGSGAGTGTGNAELQGFGDLTAKGGGTLTLGFGGSNFSVFTGQIFIASGTTVSIGALSTGSAPLGATTAGTFVLSGGVLNASGQNLGAEPLTISGTGISSGGALISSTGTGTDSGPVTLAAASSIGGAGNLNLSGVISGPFALTKVGAGNTTLSNANTYTGGTTVSAGTLTLNNTTGSAVGPGNVTLAAGGTLASGTAGTMTGNLVGATTGTTANVAPGGAYTLGGSTATFGTLNVGGLSLTSNATNLVFDLSTPAGTNDLLNVTGLDTLTVTGANKVPILLGQAPTTSGSYHLISFNQDAGGTITSTSNFSVAPGNSRLSYSLQLNSGTGNQKFLDLLVTGSTTPITANFVGTTTPTSWTTATNWSSNPSIPGLAGDVVTFNNGANAPSPLTVTLDGQQRVGSLAFNNTGTAVFNLAPGTNASVTPALVFDNTPNAAPATLTNSSNSNVISAPVSLASATNVTVTGTTGGLPNVLTLGGNLTGSAALTLTNTSTGVLALSGTNSAFTGGVTVSGGTVRAGSGSALGTAAATVNSGATLDLGGQTVGNALSLNGTGVNNAGALVNSSTTAATASGTVTLASATTLGGTNAYTISGVVAGSGTLTKTGLSNITFSNNANTDTGAVTINAGTLTLTGANGGTGTIQAPSITVNSGGTLVMTNGDTIGFTAGRDVVTINSGGSVLNNGSAKRDTFQNPVTMTGGLLAGSSVGDANGTYSLDSATAFNATSDAAGNPATVSAPKVSLQLSGGVIFNVTRGTAVTGIAPDMLVTSPLINFSTNNSPLTKTGTGILTLTGANTYTSATNVNFGTVVLNNTTGTVLGGTAVTVGNGAAITAPTAGNATLLVKGTNTVGTATAGSITVSGGDATTTGQGTLSLVDGSVNTLNLLTRTTAGTALTVGGASSPGVISLEIGTAANSGDTINLNNNAIAVNAGGTVGSTPGVGAVLNIVPIGGIVPGTYSLLTYGSQTSAAPNGGFAFPNGLQTETLNGATLTLNNTATAETLTVTGNTGPTPAAAYFKGGIDNNWSTINAANNPPTTNWATDTTGATDTNQIPGAATDVHFYATGANTANLATTLGQNFTIDSLTMDGNTASPTATQNVSIGPAGNTLTITPTTSTIGITLNPSSGSLTINSGLTLGASQTWTNNSANPLTVSGPFLAGGASALTVTGSGITTISAPITGSGLLTKNGTGTLTLSGANASTGGVTILNGTVASGIDNALGTAAALNFGTPGSGNAGTLTLGSFNQTLPTINVLTNNITPNTITVGAGKTLSLTGGLTLGYDAGTGTGATSSKLTVSGAGTMSVTGSTINVSVNQAATNAAYYSTGTLDVSGLGSGSAGFTANVTNFNVGVGTTTTGFGTVLLSNVANDITAPTLTVANSGANNANGQSTLTLGTGTNLLKANTLNIGLGNGTGVVKFASQAANTPGSVSITDATGSGPVTITVGNNNGTANAGSNSGTLDLSGHVANVNATTLLIGNNNMASNSGSVSGTVNFSAGTFNVTTLTMGIKTGAGTGAGNGALNVSGGTFTVNPGGAFTFASQATAGSANAALNISGGTFTSNVDIVTGGGLTSTGISLTAPGTLDLTGHAIGSPTATIITNFQSGTLKNVGQINGGASIATGGSGTLILAGTNAFTGTIIHGGGTLLVNGSSAASVNLTAGTLGGTGSIAGQAIIASGATLSPGNSPGVLTIGGPLNLSSGSTYLEQVGGPTPGNASNNYDQTNVTGTTGFPLAVNGSNLVVNSFNGYGSSGNPSEVYYILTQPGTTPVNGTFSGLPEGSTVTFADGSGTARITYLANWTGTQATSTLTGGNDVALYNVNTPEPAALGLLGVGALGLLARRRRKPGRN